MFFLIFIYNFVNSFLKINSKKNISSFKNYFKKILFFLEISIFEEDSNYVSQPISGDY